MRDKIKKWCQVERHRVKMEAMQGWQAKKAAAALSCAAVTTTATTAKEAMAAIEEEEEFTDITSQEEMDQVSVKVTECEQDEMIEGWVVEDAAVLEAAAVFQKNGGFIQPPRHMSGGWMSGSWV